MGLLFVYNAGSGRLSALLDLGHKILSPESYQCKLCSLTHGNFRERKEWKHFREAANLDLIFLHKDEFEKEHGVEFSYPIVLKKNGRLEVFISTEELNSMGSPGQLIELVQSRSA